MRDKVKKSAKNDQPAAAPQGVMQQMQPMLNQFFGQHGGKSTRLNMDGTIKDMNAPSGLDWLEAHGPDRASVQARQKRLGQELRPDGGLPWMAQQGAQAVEAQKQLQQMLPQDSHSVTQQWGGDDVGAVSTAMKNGVPVGFSTNTPQAKNLHQFSPHDFVAMLGQLPQEVPTQAGSLPQAGAEQLPVNAFIGQNPNNPDNFFNRDRAGVRAREQERQRHNVYKGQAQPKVTDYFDSAGDTLTTTGSELGNWIADLLGFQAQLPKATKADFTTPTSVSRVNHAHSFGEALGLPWLTPAQGQQLKQKLNEQATYKFPW